MADLLALSIRQPWAHAILHLGKDIENRGRCHRHRGLTLIHASAGMSVEEYAEPFEFIRDACEATRIRFDIPPFAALQRGAIVGAVEILDCVEASDSPWWMGPRGYVLANPRPIPPIPCKGTVTPLFWVPPPEVRRLAAVSLGVPA